MSSNDPFDADPKDPFDGEEDIFHRARQQQSDRPGVTDFVKKAIESAVGSVQNTGSVSKEAIQYVIEQGERGRQQVLRIFANEVGNFLRETDLSREVTKILTSVKMDFNASVRFTPVDDGRSVEPDVQASEVKVGLDEAPEPEPTPDVETQDIRPKPVE